MSNDLKVDLSLLKKLVSELDALLSAADAIMKTDALCKSHDYIVEMAKATGIATGITLEASLLALDIQAVTKALSGPISKDDGIGSLLNIIKGGGSLGGTN